MPASSDSSLTRLHLNPEEIEQVRDCISDHNSDRPDDKLVQVRPSTPWAYTQRVIKYLGVELS